MCVCEWVCACVLLVCVCWCTLTLLPTYRSWSHTARVSMLSCVCILHTHGYTDVSISLYFLSSSHIGSHSLIIIIICYWSCPHRAHLRVHDVFLLVLVIPCWLWHSRTCTDEMSAETWGLGFYSGWSLKCAICAISAHTGSRSEYSKIYHQQ